MVVQIVITNNNNNDNYGAGVNVKTEDTISVWVPNGQTEFYKQIGNRFLSENPDVKYKLSFQDSDTGSAAGMLIADNAICSDIVAISSDNVGKLKQVNVIKPIKSDSLKNQVVENNATKIQDIVNIDGELCGVPFSVQSLFLYYNKKYVSASDVCSFEGLQYAASKVGEFTKGWTVTGSDGFNLTFTLLARQESNGYTSLKLYDGLKNEYGSCWAQGDDEVASLKWLNKMYHESNGFGLPDSTPWEVEVQNGRCLSVIGGDWHYDIFVRAVGGEENVGIAPIPVYTIDEQSAYGTIKAGTVMRGGSFADAKVFVLNSKSLDAKTDAEERLVAYLTSKEVQKESFLQSLSTPTYPSFKTELVEIENQHLLDEPRLSEAKALSQMLEFSIPQPFVTGLMNTYYYSKNAPDYYFRAIMDNELTDRKVQETLYKMQHIWRKGQSPSSIPEVLPEDI